MRKAMAPLISSIILIMFAVGLGIIVMSWGKADAGIEPTTCDKASLAIITFDGKEQLCYTEDSIKFTIENNGEADILAVKLSVLSEEGVDSVLLNQPIAAADIQISSVSYDKNKVEAIKKIKFVPKIKDTTERLCPNNGVEAEKIQACK